MVPVAPHFFHVVASDPSRYSVDVGAHVFFEAYIISLCFWPDKKNDFREVLRGVRGRLFVWKESSYGGNYKTWVNLNFSEKGQNGKLPLQYRLQTCNFSRFWMTKRTSSLDSSHEI